MYKLIIVDDELDICDGLKKIVNWGKLGYEVIGDFCDGKDVIDFLRNYQVDVILTDIKMNNVSGLDLAKYVYENKLSIKVVILSGFREFELAKTALQYHVVNYLLKPTNFKELHNMFRELRVTLDHERAKYNEMLEHKDELVNALKEQFIIDVTSGGIKDHDKIKKRLHLIGLSPEMSDRFCSIIQLKVEDYTAFLRDSWTRAKSNLSMMMRNLFCGENESVIYYMIRFHNDILHIFVMEKVQSNRGDYEIKVGTYLSKIKESIEALMGMRFKELSIEHYKSILDLADESSKVIIPMAKGKQSIENTIAPGDLEVLYEQRKLFLSYVVDMDIQGVRDIFDTILNKLSLVDLHLLQEFIINLLVSMKNQMYSNGSKSYALLCGYRYSNLFDLKSIGEIRVWADELFITLEHFYKEQGNKVEIKAIRKAKKYMEEHFGEDISLEEVAEHVYLNPVYLSRLFKQETGENFTDYLIAVRMEKAKDLLINTHLKAYEICKKVGYSNAKYFYKIFRKYTGYTTMAYKMLNGR